jgi:Do/DeqQ family serine protease
MSMKILLIFMIAIVGAVSIFQPVVADKQVPQTKTQIQLSFAPLVKQTAPAVVNIYTRRIMRTKSRVSPLFQDPFFERFFGQGFGFGVPRERVQNSLGSGVIVQSDGIIVTNNHVIEGADEITVALADRREYEAELILADKKSDVAVLRIQTNGEDLPTLALAESDELEVGDIVLAIGNPFGVGQTVTSGIVSALARTHAGITDYQFFIQTDAAINPGNSGGALIDHSGRLVGVNTAIYSSSGGSMGIGFAIPVDMVRSVLEGALGDGKIERPWLGLSGQPVTSEIAKSLELSRPLGVLINNVHKTGPAGQAGVKVGDVVLAVDGREVFEPEGMKFRIATRRIGNTADIKILRGGRVQTIKVKMIVPPEDPPSDERILKGAHLLRGVTVGNLSPAIAIELGLPFTLTGVVVTKPAPQRSRVAFAVKDIVLALNGQQVNSVRQLVEMLEKPESSWEMSIRRNGKVRNIRVIR